MCLFTTRKVPKIAEKDIIVYKAMKRFLFLIISPIYFSPWIPGVLKKRVLKSKTHIFNDIEYEISDGLHAFLKYSDVEIYFPELKNSIYEAVIPKGSKYYISIDRKFIVSNKMKIIRKLKK